MNNLVLQSGESLLSGDDVIEADFDQLTHLGQVRVFRGVIEYIALHLPSFVRVALGDSHERYDKGLKVFDAVTTLGPDVTWADRVRELIPLKTGNQLSDADRSSARWTDRGVFLRSDGRLLEISRVSEIRGSLICNTTPLEVTVLIMSDERLIQLIASRGEMKVLFRQVIGAYRAYTIDEFGRVERGQKLQEFCDQFRFLVSQAHLGQK